MTVEPKQLALNSLLGALYFHFSGPDIDRSRFQANWRPDHDSKLKLKLSKAREAIGLALCTTSIEFLAFEA